jgi:hypothetical protein
VGLVVNLTERTVFGGEWFNGIIARISSANAVSVSFEGKAVLRPFGHTAHISGTLDRVTGAARVTEADKPLVTSFDLVCKVTNRLF